MTIHDFIEQHGIKAEISRADGNPFWRGSGFHYNVVLSGGSGERESATVIFSTGTGWTKEPKVGDVLSCLVSEAVCVENTGSFEDWCSELGFDGTTDLDEDEDVSPLCRYEASVKQTEELKELIGDDDFQTLLWDCEND